MSGALTTPRLILYGLMGLPVAIVSLPVYIHIPQFYAETVGLDLATVGIVLLLLRLVDTLQDPFIGHISDRLAMRGHSRQKLMMFGVPVLAASLLLLLNPPSASLAWFAGSLVLLYTAFSFVSINYYAYGAEWDRGYDAQSTISTWREGFILLGILLASLLPQLLVNHYGAEDGYKAFGWMMAGVMLLLVPFALRRLPKLEVKVKPQTGFLRELKDMMRCKPFRWLLIVFFVNGIANSIPATLILFYVADVLRAADQAGYFLAVYFVAGLLGMPLWLKIAKQFGKKRSLIASMVLASVSFVFAFCLGPGDTMAFYIICALVGLCLGADLAMPPAMLGDVVQLECPGGEAAAYFGVWNLIWKLTFAIAAGVTLPLLDVMGYGPSAEEGCPHGATMLAMMYALLPSVLKLTAAVILYLSPLERQANTTMNKEA